MSYIPATLFYVGAYLLPIIYLVVTRGKGKAKKKMLCGAAIHTFWIFAVYGFVLYSWKAGYREYYWGWALLVPVNLVSTLYYILALVYSHRSPQKANAA